MIDKIRAVVDTNILVSGTISPLSTPRQVILAAKENQFTLITSFEINEEILSVLHRPHIYEKYHLSEETIDDICTLLYEGAAIVEGYYKIRIIPSDPKDDKFIAAALEGNAQYIVTGDKHLLALGEYSNIKIITAKEFIEILKTS